MHICLSCFTINGQIDNEEEFFNHREFTPSVGICSECGSRKVVDMNFINELVSDYFGNSWEEAQELNFVETASLSDIDKQLELNFMNEYKDQ